MKTSVKAATVIGEPRSIHLSQSIIGRIKVQIVGLFLALATPAAAMEAPEGIVYCGGELGLLTVRTAGSAVEIEGQTIGLKFDETRLHFFNGSGLRTGDDR
jgi:hypothetical protein